MKTIYTLQIKWYNKPLISGIEERWILINSVSNKRESLGST